MSTEIGIELVTVIDPVEAAHKRFAEARSDLNRLGEDMRRIFERLELATKQLRTQGVKADVVLDPPLEAALSQWRSNGPREDRVVLESIPPAPIGSQKA